MARAETRKERALGTTGRGIGPTYEDKVARRGIRVADLLDPASLRESVDRIVREKNFELTQVHHWPPVDADAIYESACEYGRKLAPYVDHTGRLLRRALEEGKNVLFEGAQGTFLDVDHGTYPYVTSSNCVAGAACTGSGVGPTAIDHVLGISKAYTTRVGGGPFPTEDTGAAGERLRELGSEFGATTGRPRRCGWLDIVMLREAATVNGLTGLVINKLDILSGLAEVPIAVAYTIDGKRTDEFPMTLGELSRAEPVYQAMPGWDGDLSGARLVEDLPAAARRYVECIESLVEVPVEVLSVGPGRDQTIACIDPFRD
jgi:adenylosuccinate synthase